MKSMRAFAILPVLFLASAPAFGQDPVVVLATSRDGRIHFFDASLHASGSIATHQPVESVAPSPDGRRLYVAQENGPGSCCTLFALDLASKKMCQFATPAWFGVPSPDGSVLFTQGERGVDVFDTGSLVRLSTMKAPGAYSLQPSANGRWLMGITNSPQPSLDIFDLRSGALDQRLPVSSGPVTGAWAGERFYIFGYGEPGEGKLWSVKPEERRLVRERTMPLPDFHGECNQPVLLALTGSKDGLYLAEAFGFRVNRRRACAESPSGGIFRYDPRSGQLVHLAPEVYVHRMAVAREGRDLYVVDARDEFRRLVRIDAATGRLINQAPLGTGEWNLSVTSMPAALVPSRNDVLAAMSCAR